MGSSNSKLILPQISEHTAKNGMPPVIRVTQKKSWKEIICFLSEPGADPLYCINLPDGLWGNMTLHDGPDPTSPPLAHAVGEGRGRVDSGITLPVLPGAEGDPTANKEILRWRVGKKETFWFAMDVGQGADRRLERFEWRRSHGDEVKSIGESSWGWKLVRLGATRAGAGSHDDSDHGDVNHTTGRASDGKEVVAVWADSKSWKTLTKVGELHLCGSGSTGELGTSWALMVVMSCMCIWQKMVQLGNAT